MFDTSGQLVMQTAIGGAGTLFGPLVGAAVWLYLQRLPADHAASRRHLEAGARRRLRAAGLLPAPRPDRRHRRSLRACDRRAKKPSRSRSADAGVTAEDEQKAAQPTSRASRRSPPCRRATARPTAISGPILQASGLTKRYGGLVANSDIDFTVNHGELRGIIGPNGAGKTTFFKMLTCEVPPTSGQILFEGRDITGMTRHRRLPARPDQELSGQPAVQPPDGAREPDHRRAGRAARQVPARSVPQSLQSIPGLDEQVEHTLALVDLDRARRHAGVGARLRREAPARDRAGARDLAEPAAARRAARRHEPARARRDGQAAQVDQPAAAP